MCVFYPGLTVLVLLPVTAARASRARTSAPRSSFPVVAAVISY